MTIKCSKTPTYKSWSYVKCSKTLPYYFKNDKGRMTNVDTFDREATTEEIEDLKKRGYRVRRITV